MKDYSKEPREKRVGGIRRFEGTISINSKGIGYVEDVENEVDVEIQTADLATALHGDTVSVEVIGKRDKNRVIGKVTRLVKRVKDTFVGTIDTEKGSVFLIPDDFKMYIDIVITDLNGLAPVAGDKAQVKITRFESSLKSPEGKLLQVLGKKGNHDTEMRSIVLEKGFETEFPPEVEAEAHTLEKSEKPISEAEIATRRDFRKTLTMTIDPVDAKDFDDAISFVDLGDGTYEVGVHIADVSHYVREKTDLDKEARKRGFSVYLVDRTIPMLPEVLSNDLCSLNPNEDKLTFTSLFTLDKNGTVLSRWFGKSIIHSDKRFSYEEAQASITDPNGLYHKELDTLNRIAKKMQEEKFRQGAIDFEQDEIKFELDKDGVPIRVFRKKRFDAHKLVEEYMLLANREVATEMFRALKKHGGKGAFVYRIHDVPDTDKILNLSIFVRALGHDLTINKKGITTKDIQTLLKKVEGTAEESLIKTAAIRSMAKAVYSTKNVGHFGLAFEYYSHFTSPIRRYADLLVHRLLQRELTGGKVGSNDFAFYEKLSQENSEREIKAAEAERASIKYKQVEFISKKVGQEFNGTISGVTEWGIYVEEEETRADGMIKLRDMTDDNYIVDPKNYCVVGEKTKKRYMLGDKVKVKLMGVDLEKKTIDWKFI